MTRRVMILFPAALSLLAGPTWAVERGALFKVSGHGHMMYLFGTIHMGLPEFFPLDESVTRALAASTTLATVEYAKLGYRPDLAIDAHLAKLAHSQNIKVVGLETVESQRWRQSDSCI